MNSLNNYNLISKNGSEYLIRPPKLSDLKILHEYINTLSNELTYVNYQGEVISLSEERTYLKEQLTNIEQKKSVMLLALNGKVLVGIASIDLGDGASSHTGELGLSIHKNYRNKGLGNQFLKLILNLAEKNLTNLRIVTLTVFDINTQAYNMYLKNGFIEYGRLPKGVYFKGKHYDRIYMYKKNKYLNKLTRQ